MLTYNVCTYALTVRRSPNKLGNIDQTRTEHERHIIETKLMMTGRKSMN